MSRDMFRFRYICRPAYSFMRCECTNHHIGFFVSKSCTDQIALCIGGFDVVMVVDLVGMPLSLHSWHLLFSQRISDLGPFKSTNALKGGGYPRKLT